MVIIESFQAGNLRYIDDLDFEGKLNSLYLKVVTKEEDVANRTEKVLDEFSRSDVGLSGGVDFLSEQPSHPCQPWFHCREAKFPGLGNWTSI